MEIHQIALVVKDVEKAVERYSSVLGLGPFRRLELDMPEANSQGGKRPMRAKLAFARAGAVELELIEPGEGDSFYREFLEAKGESMHHVGIRVTDIENAVSGFGALGIGVLQSGRTEHIAFAYMDTEKTMGMIVEFTQRL